MAHFGFDAADVHLFDAETGRALAHGMSAGMNARHPDRHRRRHLGHQVGRLHARRASRSARFALPNIYADVDGGRAPSRTWRAPGPTRPPPCAASPTLVPDLDEPHRRDRRHGPGRRHLADRRRRPADRARHAVARRARRPTSSTASARAAQGRAIFERTGSGRERLPAGRRNCSG